MVARLTGQASRFGVEFDSLSDVVSFVAAPMLLLYPLTLRQYNFPGVMIAFLFVAAGTIRLARYNVEVKSLTVKSAFHGLPVPAAGCLAAGYLIFCNYLAGEVLYQHYIPPAILLLGLLMVSTIEYPAVSTIARRSAYSYVIYAALVMSVIGMVVRSQLVMFPLLLAYVLLGLVGWTVQGAKKMFKGKKIRREKIDNG